MSKIVYSSMEPGTLKDLIYIPLLPFFFVLLVGVLIYETIVNVINVLRGKSL